MREKCVCGGKGQDAELGPGAQGGISEIPELGSHKFHRLLSVLRGLYCARGGRYVLAVRSSPRTCIMKCR